ncbi:MAG TPA: peptidoglycan editing factor PgeF [Rubrivivax sp.]|nr:peptidoglycan editing factor PgeF [Rubrivivax sp.]
MSQRAGGVSMGPWASLNLGGAVGDDPAAVAENRARFTAALGARPVWLRQVHGEQVVRLRPDAVASPLPPADAAWTSDPGLACAVLVADCLPVLLALRDGSAVAAAHAGWRGLAAGVLEATVQALCAGTGAGAGDIVAWLGPCIGPRQFEVGADVLQAFSGPGNPAAAACFNFRPRLDGSPRWLADLPRLARERLAAAGVSAVSEAGRCTVEDASRYFSFRRDGVTGRHGAAIWRR